MVENETRNLNRLFRVTTMHKRDRKRITKKISELKRWRENCSESLLQSDLDQIKEDMTDEAMKNLSWVSLSLSRVSMFDTIPAMLNLEAGEADCWNVIFRGIIRDYWATKIQVTKHFRDTLIEPHLALELPRVACFVCFGYVCNFEHPYSFCIDVLRKISENPTLVTGPRVGEPFWEQRRFEPFVLWLFNQLEDIHPANTDSVNDFGPYQGVIDLWNDGDQLVDSLLSICDYHCDHMFELPNWHAEFDRSPFDLVPFEMLAIFKVRKQLGLETPRIDHPLLTSPLAAPIVPEKLPEDELLKKVQNFYHQVVSTLG